MREAGLGVQLHYMPVHLHPFYRRLGFCDGQFPYAEEYASCALSLPLFPGLTGCDQRLVTDVLQSLLI